MKSIIWALEKAPYKTHTVKIMKTLLTSAFLVLTAIACSGGPSQYSNSMTSKLGLDTYSEQDLENPELKKVTAFIFTLLANTHELKTHQFNGANHNEVFVNYEKVNGGYREAVFQFERDANGEKIEGTGKLVTDCENKGSFNYKHPKTEPLGHFSQDIFPWINFGNCREDKTTKNQRISAYIADITSSLERIVKNNSAYQLPDGFRFQEDEQPGTIAFFIASLEKSGFDLHRFVTSDRKSLKDRKEFYRSLEAGMKILLSDI